MSSVLIALSNGLHALATVILVGHYLLLSLLYLPVLSKMEPGGSQALGEISQRSRPWLYASLLIFMVTGIYLTFVDPNYGGIGNFSSLWAVLMLVKHVVIMVLLALGFWFNAIERVGTLLRSNTGAARGQARLRLYSAAMSVCGVLILLLTVFAQVE